MNKRIVLQTDFGLGIAVASMHGVCASIDNSLIIMDANHDVTPFNTFEASQSLMYYVPFFPAGTVFVSVVDPGVGTSRRASVAKLSNGSYVVSPDNGSFTHMKKCIGIEAVREIDETVNRLKSTEACSIFHGRDLFSYCAAKLAAGIIDFEGVGPEYPVDEIVVHEVPAPRVENGRLHGILQSADRHFGLNCTNIPYQMMDEIGVKLGDRIRVILREGDRLVMDEVMSYVKSFGFVERGELLAMISETLELQFARNYENLSVELDLGTGPDWTVEVEKA